MSLKTRLQTKQVDMWTATKAMMVTAVVFIVFVAFAQVQFWASSNARADDKAEAAAEKNWDLQLKVTEGEIAKLTTCIDSVSTREDFRGFGNNIFNLFEDVLTEAQAPQDPFLDRVEESRVQFFLDFKERKMQNCTIPTIPPKPEDVPEDYNPPIPTIPEEYLQRLIAAGVLDQESEPDE